MNTRWVVRKKYGAWSVGEKGRLVITMVYFRTWQDAMDYANRRARG